MSIRDLTSQRLYVEAPLSAGALVTLGPEQASYLRAVLRLPQGAEILVFNGRDGEWRARLELVGKRDVRLAVIALERAQAGGPDLQYVFAPLKRARTDYMVQKAVELGAARLTPVLTQHTVAERVNGERMRANAIEAAEQCGILQLPRIDAPVRLAALLADWDDRRLLVFCDEILADAASAPHDPISALQDGFEAHLARLGADSAAERRTQPRLAVLIGPEGGFTEPERALVRAKPSALAIGLGPRIMRADTAAVAALTLVGAVLGDWRR